MAIISGIIMYNGIMCLMKYTDAWDVRMKSWCSVLSVGVL